MTATIASLAEKQAFIVGLLEKCPHKKAPDNCPAINLRNLPAAERVDLVLGMPEETLDDIIAHHLSCEREQRGQAANP